MKYTVEIDVDLPRERVVALFDNPDNLPKWQHGLESMELISGEPGQPGAKSRLKFKMGKREIEMVETILQRDLPEVYSGAYEAPGVYNTVTIHFSENADGTTHLLSENEFQFKSFMMKAMGFLMPGAFKKQTRQYMEQFKAFAEGADEEE